jgi:hypothetical protein
MGISCVRRLSRLTGLFLRGLVLPGEGEWGVWRVGWHRTDAWHLAGHSLAQFCWIWVSFSRFEIGRMDSEVSLLPQVPIVPKNLASTEASLF